MGFESPAAFLLLIPLVLLPAYGRRNRGFFIHHNEGKNRCSAGFLSGLCSVLFYFSLFIIITALSGPSIRNEKTRYLTRGDDYFFILDASPSMSVADITGMRRIDAAKKVVTDFSKTRGNDYPGLILFSDEAYLAVPPTADLNWFDEAVKRSDVIYPDRGTAIGDAVALAVFYLKKSDSDNKTGILISDGVSNTGRISPAAAARIAYENSIKIYTVSAGRKSDDAKEDSPDVLKQISSDTGALSFSGEDIKELEYAFSFIGNIEERERDREKVVSLESFEDLFIISGLILMILSVLIRTFILKEIDP